MAHKSQRWLFLDWLGNKIDGDDANPMVDTLFIYCYMVMHSHTNINVPNRLCYSRNEDLTSWCISRSMKTKKEISMKTLGKPMGKDVLDWEIERVAHKSILY